MGRVSKNFITLTLGADGLYHLRGHFMGTRIRLRSANPAPLEEKKLEMERLMAAEKKRGPEELRLTWLSAEQLRDAEAATARAHGKKLFDCVVASERVLVDVKPVSALDALNDWLKALEARHREKVTLNKNRLRVKAFLEACGASYLHEIKPEHIEKFVQKKSSSTFTQLTDASVLQAWLSFCAKKKWLRSSPFEIDMKDAKASARSEKKPSILTAKQCWSLFDAAKNYQEGKLLPYVVLATWCFLRHAEVLRTTGADIKVIADEPVVEVVPKKRGTVSYRAVDIPEVMVPVLKDALKTKLILPKEGVFFSKSMWETVREKAGLLKLGTAKGRHGKRPHKNSIWQENILRHTGISFFYQKTKNIRETCRQAGNSDDTAFAHYIRLPKQGEERQFYKITAK